MKSPPSASILSLLAPAWSAHLRNATTSTPSTPLLHRALNLTPKPTSKRFFTSTPPRPANPTPTPTRPRGPYRPDYSAHYKQGNTSLLYYTASMILGTLSVSYASVPLYRLICQRTGYGGTPLTSLNTGTHISTPDKLVPLTTHPRIRVTFTSSVSDLLDWSFTPQQREVRVHPGETALAFYTATNNTEEDIIGVATYSVTPGQVAPYFAKIQCFCFEEQKLAAGESVDMPVLFFLDPELVKDPGMKGVEQVTLSYTFFRAKYDSNSGIRPRA
ncbi:cytochrome c oxidase assembly protein CtaG/Cox11-domain-containing protein [Peziza echinospora]|nr:cytochrome c oxidase assembly protein CtaG/Cox11-domain-containing protein [Peziza echinospora]